MLRMVIGGAWQGKRAYAEAHYQITGADWTDGSVCSREEFLKARAVCGLHTYIRRRMEAGAAPEKVADEILAVCGESLQVVTSDEVGYGVVPMDAGERAWREACGRICTRLAARADQVVRVCCGIGTVIKG